MNASLPDFLRRAKPHLRATLLVAVITLAVGVAWAQTRIDPNGVNVGGSVIGDDVLYSIGGGRAVSMGGAGNMQSIGVGVGWNSNLICGDMSITTTLQNQLNGISNGFQTIMSNVIQNATSAVASLPALIIQRADPGLYNLLTNGILQARLDFDRSKMTCRAIANRMADMAGGQAGWDQLAEGMALRDAVSSTDAVSAIEQAESNKGNNGVPWVGGSNAGGSSQSSIKVVGDVTRAGYNLLNGRSATDTSLIARNACGNRLTCQTWSSPQAAAAFANRVLGEREQRTCESCTKTQTTPGVGLTPMIQEEYETKLQVLQELVTGARPTTLANLDAAGSSSLPITRGVIEALRDEPDHDLLGKRLASEAALSSVLEKALLLQRTLLTGKKEPNVAANELAVRAVDQENSALEQEINNLKTELELRRTLAGNSAMAIIQRHSIRAVGSRGVFEGDTTRDRLREVQKPRSGTP
ncbi:TPA: integrating conjugative element protein [Pseudomonas aeruginosa]|jgi:integrating conjugative element protein (TIGR03755 family)|uniref:Integrating conjugative element protein n=3 Tax=Stutzerimonas stutzeri group TaxID=136846 RepID=A0A172WSA4_STUST|nr:MULTISPECIES: integrating conjugative element protein [Pseudomonadaceae]MBU0563214.1 integrating conjugative element protein [Gammaproteobacteria bacterium]MBU2391650.1 integrating conjugative element protein [Alphaproteobacteria bacterium]ANF26332.1 integrating conjugative element protein [Stutzerimonas stutzeri]AXL68775.1 integrating conjugative element protein [Pseudomonas aeruginosa]MBG0844371.1 integrating conjugative element protein [Pseudomonas chengduensis]